MSQIGNCTLSTRNGLVLLELESPCCAGGTLKHDDEPDFLDVWKNTPTFFRSPYNGDKSWVSAIGAIFSQR